MKEPSRTDLISVGTESRGGPSLSAVSSVEELVWDLISDVMCFAAVEREVES